MSDNNTKIAISVISTIGGIVTSAMFGFAVMTIFCGQWWVTPKHKAKALCMINAEHNRKKDYEFVAEDNASCVTDILNKHKNNTSKEDKKEGQ